MTEKRSYGPEIVGRCPACKKASLFIGVGGHVTCARLECPAPTAADDALREDGYTFIRQDELRAGEAGIAHLERRIVYLEGRVATAEAAVERMRTLIDSYPPGSDFVQCGAAQTFRDHLDGTKGAP